MKIHSEEIESTHRPSAPTRATLRRRDQSGPRPLVLVLHGFKGFRDWGFFPHLGEQLANAGFTSVVIDFSLNGIGDQRGAFTRLDLFGENCLSHELEDAAAILDLVTTRDDVDVDRVGVLGHSRGGATAILLAEKRADISALAGWATVADVRARVSDSDWQAWQRDGFREVVNARTGQRMRIGRRLRDEVGDPDRRWQPLRAAAEIHAPLLLVHGDRDEAVPVTDAHALLAARPQHDTELVVVEGAGHTFGAVHPFAGTTPELDQAVAATIAFFTTSFDRPAQMRASPATKT